MKLRCYVCGDSLGKEFWLVAYQQESDRVFVFDSSCVKRIDPEALAMKVRG